MTSPLVILGSWNGTEGYEGLGTSGASKEFLTILGLVVLVSALIATSGNGLVVTVIARKGVPSTVTPIFIANLSSAHLLHCVLVLSLESAYLLLGLRWIFSDGVCKAVVYMDSVMSSTAILTLCAISIDRYYSVVYPLDRKLSLFKGTLMVTYTWTHSVIISLPHLFSTKETRTLICRDSWTYLMQAQVFLVVYTTLTIICPLLLISVAYYLVWRGFRSSHRRVNIAKPSKHQKPSSATLTHASKTEMRLLQTLVSMVSCFVILWAPRVVCSFIYYFVPSVVLSEYYILISFGISKLQLVVDPFIYGYLNKHFRKHLREFVRACSVQCLNDIGNDEIMTSEDLEFQGHSPAVSPLPASSRPLNEEQTSQLTSQRKRTSVVSNVYKGNAYTFSFAAGTVDMQTVVEEKEFVSEADSLAMPSHSKRHRKKKSFTKRLADISKFPNYIDPLNEKECAQGLPAVTIDNTRDGQVLFKVNLKEPVGVKCVVKDLTGQANHDKTTMPLNPKTLLPVPKYLPSITKKRNKIASQFSLPVPLAMNSERNLTFPKQPIQSTSLPHSTRAKRKRRKILSKRLEQKSNDLKNIMAHASLKKDKTQQSKANDESKH